MELQEATPTEGDGATSTASLASWFDYLSLEDFLGHGSFGFVFKAVSPTQEISAVKIIFMDFSGKTKEEVEDDRQRISREYHLIEGKQHENILKILKSTDTPFTPDDFEHIKNLNCLAENGEALDFIELQCIKVRRGPIPSFCMQMELCGKTLRQWLNAQSVDNPELYPIQGQIIAGMLQGLKYLHDHNIMHRDFRPENAMFTYSITEEFALPIKIGDFGLCRKAHSEHTKTRTLTPGVGNETYRAPETTGSNYGVQADLYSFGLVLWEVTQLIKYKDTRSMFYKLVHESKTNLVKNHPHFRTMKEFIILLTKRRVQDRAKSIHEFLVPEEPPTVMKAETEERLRRSLKMCRPEDTIEISGGIDVYQLSIDTSKVTICGKGGLITMLTITANDCTINKLNTRSLTVDGNFNRISDVTCEYLIVMGNTNKITNCIIKNTTVNPRFIKDTMDKLGSEPHITGNDNVLEDCIIMCDYGGLVVGGSRNTILSTSFKNVRYFGLAISGSHNNVHNCEIKVVEDLLNNDPAYMSKYLGNASQLVLGSKACPRSR